MMMNSLQQNHASKQIMLHGKAKPFVQPKIMVNTPGDIYEQEADAMADRVMQMSTKELIQPETGLIGKSLQRKCAHCEDEEKRKPLMRKAEGGNSGMAVSLSFATTLNSSKGSGSPLPKGTRSFMENALSADFSSVKIHTDSKASEMSRGINAKAFTYENDIYFNKGEYAPENSEGKKLLAHELAHVLQQQTTIQQPDTIQRAAFVCDEYRTVNQTSYNPGPGINLSLNGHAITITANLEVFGTGATATRAAQIKNTIERIWNNSFDDGYSVSTSVNIQVQGSEADSSRTLIQIISGSGMDVTRPHYWIVGSNDIIYYTGSDINWVPAHEFGHLLGLSDRYSEGVISKLGGLLFNSERTNTVEAGWEGNLMAVDQGILEKKNLEDLIRIGFSPRMECASGHLESPL